MKTCFRVLISSVVILSAASGALAVDFFLSGNAGVGLLPGNLVGPTTGGSGGEVGGGITYDMGSKMLSVVVGWGSGNGFTDLTGPATTLFIQGPATIAQNAGQLFNLGVLGGFNTSASSGGYNNSVGPLTAAQETDLLNGLYYLNVRTADRPAGELRANMFPVPEPSAFVLLGFGAGALVFAMRRRRNMRGARSRG